MPLAKINTNIVSNPNTEISLHLQEEGISDALVPFEPFLPFSGGINLKFTRDAGHHDAVDVSAKEV